MSRKLLEIRDICEQIDTEMILNHINLELYSGEVLGIIGMNGVGKSTLVSVISGNLQPTSGELYLLGEETCFSSPAKAIKSGVTTLYQTVNLFPELTVAENIFIGHWPKNAFGQVDRRKMKKEAEQLLRQLGLTIDCSAKVASLYYAQKRTVELAKALSMNAKIVVLDEPFIGYTGVEIKEFSELLGRIKESGTGIILVSHQIEYILELCDRVGFMKRDYNLHMVDSGQFSRYDIMRNCYGIKDTHIYPKIPVKLGRCLLDVSYLSSDHLHNISFRLYKHEIVGLLGESLSDYHALGNILLGGERMLGGAVTVNGRELDLAEPSKLKQNRIGYVSDNMDDNLFYNLNVAQNITITNIQRRKFFADKQNEQAAEVIKALGITGPDRMERVDALSFGNQQKVRLGQCLLAACQVYIIEEPTAGIDVRARIDVYNYIMNLALGGAAFLLISTNVDELVGMCDRIIVLKNGQINTIVGREDFSRSIHPLC